MEKIRKLIKNKWIRLACVLAVFTGFAVVLTLAFDTACIIKLVTGLPCPSCGMARANIAALSLDFKAAFKMHPLWWYSVAAAGLLIVSLAKPQIMKKKLFSISCIVLAIILIAVFVVRLFLTYPEPPLDIKNDSLLGLIVNWIKTWFS